jgi:hypothetical protein
MSAGTKIFFFKYLAPERPQPNHAGRQSPILRTPLKLSTRITSASEVTQRSRVAHESPRSLFRSILPRRSFKVRRRRASLWRVRRQGFCLGCGFLMPYDRAKLEAESDLWIRTDPYIACDTPASSVISLSTSNCSIQSPLGRCLEDKRKLQWETTVVSSLTI